MIQRYQEDSSSIQRYAFEMLLAHPEVPDFETKRPVAVLGDIHGCYDALKNLVARIPERQLFVVGDICDRGPDTRRVIDLLIAKNAQGVMGNHEQWFIKWANTGILDSAAAAGLMGSEATFKSYGIVGGAQFAAGAHAVVPEQHRTWLKSLHHVAGLRVFAEDYWLVHAGIHPVLGQIAGLRGSTRDIVPRLFRERDSYALWSRHPPEDSFLVDRPVIMGHTCRKEPIVSRKVIAIDTGAGTMRDGKLTALLLPEKKTISEPAPGLRP